MELLNLWRLWHVNQQTALKWGHLKRRKFISPFRLTVALPWDCLKIHSLQSCPKSIGSGDLFSHSAANPWGKSPHCRFPLNFHGRFWGSKNGGSSHQKLYPWFGGISIGWIHWALNRACGHQKVGIPGSYTGGTIFQTTFWGYLPLHSPKKWALLVGSSVSGSWNCPSFMEIWDRKFHITRNSENLWNTTILF